MLLVVVGLALSTSFTSANLVPSSWVGISVHPVAAGQLPPTARITFPVDAAHYGAGTWNAGCSASICGTAHDSGGGADVTNVKVSLLGPSGQYWNGSSFAAATEQKLSASGTTGWSYAFAAASFAAAGGGDGSYTVKAYAMDSFGNVQAPPARTVVTVDATAPTNALSLVAQSPAGSSFKSGNTVYYRRTGGGAGGSFKLRNAVSDSGSGPASSTTAAQGGTSTGWTHTPSTVTTPAGGPYDSNAFVWAEGATSLSTEVVTGADALGNTTAAAALTFRGDSAAPVAGALSVNGTAATVGGSSSSSTAGSFAIGSRADYTDALSGLASSTLTRQAAALSSGNGIAAGSCGTFGSATTIVGSPSQSLTGPACYLFTLSGRDNVGNAASISTTVMVDTTAPSSPSVTLSAASGSTYLSGSTAYVNAQAGKSGGFTATATSTDADTGIQQLAFPALTGFSAGGGTDTVSPYGTAYTWSGAVGASGTQTVTATNTAGTTGSGSFTVTPDTAAPTGAVLTVNGTPATVGGSTTSTSATGFAINVRTDYTDAASGLASSTLTIQSATLSGVTCGAPGSGGDYTSPTAIAGTTQPAITAGFCYVYTLSGLDNVGNAASRSTQVAVGTAAPDLRGVVGGFGCGATCAWVVGADGTILYTANGTTFSAEVSGVATKLRSVASPADNAHVWAVGDNGTILLCTSSCTTPASAVWVQQVSNTTADLYSVGGADNTHVWAVGNGGVIVFWNGSSWTVQQSGMAYDLRGVDTYVEGTTAWAVGTGGTILNTTNGTTWAALTSPTASTLYSVTAYQDDKHAWAVGAGGTIVKTANRTTWSSVTSPTVNTLYGAGLTKANSPDAGHPLVAVGTVGGIYASTNGNSFTGQTSGTTNSLFGTNWGSGTSFWAVGNSGTILYTSNAGTAWTAARVPLVSVSSSTGVAGATVALTGTGFANSTALSAKLNGTTVALGGSLSTNGTGQIAGTTFTVPASPGCTVRCSVVVSDGTSQGVAYYTVNSAPQLTSAASTGFTLGSPGTFTVTATGLPAPTLSQTGTLPAGVTFNATTGVLSGTPTGATGTFPLTFAAENGVGSNASQSFTLTVGSVPVVTSAASTTFAVGAAGSFTATASGFPVPTFGVTGSLPSGVTLGTNGVLAGTPAGGTGGSYPVTVTATNAFGAGNQSFTLTVNQAPAITSAATTNFLSGSPGAFQVTATGTPAPTFSATGALPSGVTLSAAGALAGTAAPGTAGSYPITITASNGIGANATQSFTLVVNDFTIGGIQFVQVAPINGSYTCTATVFTAVSCVATGVGGTNLTGHIQFFTGSGGYGYPETPSVTNTSGSPITIASSSVTNGGTPNPASFTIPVGSANSNDITLTHAGANNLWTFSYTLGSATYTLTVKVS